MSMDSDTVRAGKTTGYSAVGSALAWGARGREFKSH